ncbi:MAG TPA: lipopolysaccharide heptosyltransferase I [Gallionellaceae bacterium]|nr:lipopolysaccharide heptosyltransferase I [Gallionellaceae bacterium]HQS75709.1 lipopolysaccharide heptosyltransferase I [Gallionellaceae bacterium]
MYYSNLVFALNYRMQYAPKIVLIKTSSLGDVLHNLPVVTDICKHLPDASIDWVVEESFAALPSLHPKVQRVVQVAMRRWRKSLWSARGEIKSLCRELHAQQYDLALDTQGLLKSALITRCIKNVRVGMDWNSAREPIASLFYNRTFYIPKNQHAVERNRQLAGLALGYTPIGAPDYGIQAPVVELPWFTRSSPYVVLLHATSRDDKLWEDTKWIALGKLLAQQGKQLVLPWGSEKEKIRSERLTVSIPNAICPPRLNLVEAAALLGHAEAVIGVDTGLSHLAAALNVPTIGIYTATNPGLTGLYAGKLAVNLGGVQTSPSVDEVMSALRQLLQHD